MMAQKFFSGKPCKRGHTSARLVSSGACCECQSELNRAKYEAESDRIIDQVRKYRAENPDAARRSRLESDDRNRIKIRERDRARTVGERKEKAIAKLNAWSAANPEKKRASVSAWAKANPGKMNARAAKYRASKLQATPPWADLDLIEDIYTLASIYREHAGMNVEVDHIFPLQGKKVCGLHVPANLQIIDSILNKAKSNCFAAH